MIWYNDKHRERSLRSFASFVAENPLYVFKDGKWICPECNGRKRVIADYEKPDPAEGFADRVPCPTCHGTGEYTEKGWRVYFSKERKNFIQQRKDKREKDALIKQALSKLTVSEQKALGVYRYK